MASTIGNISAIEAAKDLQEHMKAENIDIDFSVKERFIFGVQDGYEPDPTLKDLVETTITFGEEEVRIGIPAHLYKDYNNIRQDALNAAENDTNNILTDSRVSYDHDTEMMLENTSQGKEILEFQSQSADVLQAAKESLSKEVAKSDITNTDKVVEIINTNNIDFSNNLPEFKEAIDASNQKIADKNLDSLKVPVNADDKITKLQNSEPSVNEDIQKTGEQLEEISNKPIVEKKALNKALERPQRQSATERIALEKETQQVAGASR